MQWVIKASKAYYEQRFRSTTHSQYSSRYVGNFTLSLLPYTIKPLGPNNLLCSIKEGIHVYKDNYK
jgi:hypothetical protein